MAADEPFRYDVAFGNNLGLLTPEEQSRLRRATVALPGMGGVGGAHLLTLTRLGIGRFVIADGDRFEPKNFNRQTGATTQTVNRPKVEVMAEMARAINPEVSIRIVPQELHQGNLPEFLANSHVVVDGLDFFRIDARRALFREAKRQGLHVITCGPLGFSAALLVFGPRGPSFDEFMAIDDRMDEQEQLLRFAVGLAPAGLHLPYVDRASVSLKDHRGPSSMIAINLCAAVAATEVLNVLLNRRPPLCVPRYAQFDPFRLRYRLGTLPGGNRHPLQRLKLWYVRRLLRNGGHARAG